MALPPIAAHYSFIDPERMKGWFDLAGWPPVDSLPTQVYRPSAEGRVCDSESSPAKDRRSTIVPCHQLTPKQLVEEFIVCNVPTPNLKLIFSKESYQHTSLTNLVHKSDCRHVLSRLLLDSLFLAFLVIFYFHHMWLTQTLVYSYGAHVEYLYFYFIRDHSGDMYLQASSCTGTDNQWTPGRHQRNTQCKKYKPMTNWLSY